MCDNYYDIFIDGGARGNPGEAGIGVAIYRDNNIVKNIAKFIGIATNNVAEYLALIYALQEALINNYRNVRINTDSELIYKQLNGQYRVKNPDLKIYFDQIQHLISGFSHISFKHIPREDNKYADKLVNEAIDKRPVHLKQRKKAGQDDQLLGLA